MAELGMKYSVKKTPVTIRIRNDKSAISPSMNDQWSGKILSMNVRPPRARPKRSSSSSSVWPTRP